MAIKDKLLTYGLIGAAIIVLAKPIADAAGKVGASIGGAFSTGLQDFASTISGGLIPAAGQGGSGVAMTGQNNIMSMMMPNAAMGASNAAAADTAITAGSSAAEAAALTAIKGGMSFESSLPKGGLTGGLGQGQSLIDMLTNIIKGSSADVTFTTQGLNDIFKSAYDYLNTGATDVTNFLKTFKFPSGESLQDVLGGVGKGGLTPEAFGAVQEMAAKMMAAMPMSGLVDITTHVPSPAMMAAMNLNIDKKIDTPYGVIGYGGNPNSSGLGMGNILPPQNLTQELAAHPNLTASEAADLLARSMMNFGNFNFGSNTGAGVIAMFMPAMMKGAPDVVTGLENNPVLLAYQAYKAMYGG